MKSNLATSLKFQATRKKTSTRQSKIYNLKSCALNHQRLVRGVIYTIAFTLLFQSTAPAFALTTSIDFTIPSDYTLEDSTKVELSEGKLQLSGGDTTETVEDVFSTYLYEGNGTSQTIENGIDLEGEGGMVWIKRRGKTDDNLITDTERGLEKQQITNYNGADFTDTDVITAFNSDGFSIGADARSNQLATDGTYTSWTFRKAPGFFDIVTYTGDGVAGREIAHDLGVEPGMIITKSTSNTSNWLVYHRATGATKELYLQLTNEAWTNQVAWNDTEPTSSVFTVGTSISNNSPGRTYVAYLFAHDPSEDGKIQCGSYVGDGTTDYSKEINLGWEPQFLITRRTNNTSDWFMADIMRGFNTGNDLALFANTSGSESSQVIGHPTAN